MKTTEDLDRHIEEDHYTHRLGWLRAAVLGANDGIISVSSVLVGVIASGMSPENILIVGLATLFAGIFAMSAGEYVSVSSQLDTEKVDLNIERKRIEDDWEGELRELALVFQKDGVSEDTAYRVAKELMDNDPILAHAKYELGLHEVHSANPLQAAMASGGAFLLGGIIPVIFSYLFIGFDYSIGIVASSSLLLLYILGALASHVGGANFFIGGFRVASWGALAMVVTILVGMYFGAFH